MNFRILKSFLFLAVVTVLGLACKEAPEKLDEAPVEQSTNPATTEKTAPEKVVLNPKHGEPGHRCDIAVGAPLNSKNDKKTTENINPPHGQPGHRCDLPVGAALPE